jgi:hypothetical protein
MTRTNQVVATRPGWLSGADGHDQHPTSVASTLPGGLIVPIRPWASPGVRGGEPLGKSRITITISITITIVLPDRSNGDRLAVRCAANPVMLLQTWCVNLHGLRRGDCCQSDCLHSQRNSVESRNAPRNHRAHIAYRDPAPYLPLPCGCGRLDC